MKIRLPIVFLFGVLTLLATALYAVQNPQIIQNRTLSAYAASDIVIYGDQLSPSFTDWSWNSDRNFNASEQVKEGSSAIKFTPQAWGGLYLHTESSIDPTQYDSLTFSIRNSADNQKLSIILYDLNNQIIASPRPLTDFIETTQNGVWTTYTISLVSINPSQTPFRGVALQEASGQPQPAVYIDNISLISRNQITQSGTASLTNSSALDSVFDDAVNNGWENWSWNSEVAFDNQDPVLKENRSIRLRTTSAWGALYLHARESVNTTPYSHLTFRINATAPDQQYAVILLDKNNNLLTNPRPLEDIGTTPQPGSWTTYTVPLNTLHASTTMVSGIIIQDQSGNSQPPILIDDIGFISTTTQPLPTQKPYNPSSGDSNPIRSLPLFIDPNSNAKATADTYQANGRISDSELMSKIANTAAAIWLTGGDAAVKTSNYIAEANKSSSLPVFITYNIPGRDCGQYSSGGTSYDQYKTWIQSVATAVGNSKAVFILEPDALGLDCLQNENTYSLLRFATETLKAHPAISVYLTASTWVAPENTASRLKAAGLDNAQGFAINVSGFDTTEVMTEYGTTVSQKTGNKHFVIDTSRNGNGPYDQSQNEPWCNPPGRALGNRPTTNTGNTLIDAYLWLKIPGESDGTCRGGPTAGQWWPEYALSLAQKAAY